jgi:hypothetical protein
MVYVLSKTMFFLSMLFASSLFVLNDAVRLEQNVASLPAVFFCG